MDNKKTSVITSIILGIVGVLLILWSEVVTDVISKLVGVFLIVAGSVNLYDFYKSDRNSVFARSKVLYGVISFIAGIVFFTKPGLIKDLISVVVGIYILIASMLKIREALALKKIGIDKWLTPFVLAVIELVCAFLCIFGNLIIPDLVIQFIGIILVFYAVIDIINAISVNQTNAKVTRLIKDEDVKEAIVEEIPKKKGAKNE